MVGGDQLGIPFGGRVKTCPVGLLKAWLELADIQSGRISGRY